MRKLALVLASLLLQLTSQGASTINFNNNSAWGANIGWTNWLPSAADGVVTGEYVCSGNIYGANLGWINMGGGSPANHIQYQNNSATDFGVNYTVDPAQPGVGILRGYAYGANIGWIKFEAVGNPRISLFTGSLSGSAYSANCGWINLNDTSGRVQTDHLAMGADTNNNGIADAWEYLYFGGLLLPGQENTDPHGTGMTALQDYIDGVDPTVANSGLRITAFLSNLGGATWAITFNSNSARLYSIETNADLLSPWQPDATFGAPFAPDVGNSTTRTVTSSGAPKDFYRVKTMRPLP